MRNPTENQIELILLRHGSTPANERRQYLGRGEESLSDRGVWEIKELAKHKNFVEGALIFSSPMVRCIETAALLFPKQKPFLIQSWKEIDFGRWEGKTYQELEGDSEYQAWIDSGGTLCFPGGESREAFQRRSLLGLLECLDVCKKQASGKEWEAGAKEAAGQNRMDKAALLSRPVYGIVHGGTIMALLSGLTGEEYFSFQVKNGGGYRLWLETGSGKLQKWEEL